jgi:hypothetical protein
LDKSALLKELRIDRDARDEGSSPAVTTALRAA